MRPLIGGEFGDRSICSLIARDEGGELGVSNVAVRVAMSDEDRRELCSDMKLRGSPIA